MDRFWSKVDKTDGCWLWTAAKTVDGYGRFSLERRNRRAHRIAYELEVGPIPDGLVLDHLCRVRHCVNPAHLEPVHPNENTVRGLAHNVNLSHCKRGHPLSGGNLYEHGHSRYCRTCKRLRMREIRSRRRVGR